jgi:hypothetical protein
MRKNIFTFLTFLIFSFTGANYINSQEEILISKCYESIKSPFIVSGQPFKAFITEDEVAEFHTTFFAGSTYRIVACSPQEQNVIFSVYDKERNLLFSNETVDNAPFWDFKVEGSLECIVEAKLNKEKSTSGIALLLVGFKSNKQIN